MKTSKCDHPIFTRPTMVSHVLDLVPTKEFDSLFQRDPVPVFEDEFGKLAPVVQKALNAAATADTIEAPIVRRETIRPELKTTLRNAQSRVTTREASRAPEGSVRTTQMDVTKRQPPRKALRRPPTKILVVNPQTSVEPAQIDPVQTDPFVASDPVMDPTEPFRPVMLLPPEKRRLWSVAKKLVGRPRWPIVLGSFGAVLLGAIGALFAL